ncbi:MAG: pantetheine-phosphate adenylyltransferase [Phycisphaerae bacterium]|nr:pantetheine-phosphate adenylyltransferase [Phycisphaerae bacterium]
MPQSNSSDKVVAIYAGSFDPVTNGHLDIIQRAAGLFAELVVGVGQNPQKQPLFSAEERIALISPHVAKLRNVRVEAYSGLTVDFVKHMNARVIVRGIRDVADFAGEQQQANLNRVIGHVETVFFIANETHMVTSSTFIRQIFELGGGDRETIGRLVPPNVARALSKRLGGRARRADDLE